MHGIVATAGEAGNRVGDEIVAQRRMSRRFLKGACAEMAVQALPVVIGHVEMNRIHRRAEVLHVDVVQTAPFRADSSIKDVVFVAGKACLLGGNAVVLEVRGWDVFLVVHVQAPAVWFHDVTGETKRRLFGPIHLFRRAQETAQDGQGEQRHERQNFPATVRGERRPKNKQKDEARAQPEQHHDERLRRKHHADSTLPELTSVQTPLAM